MKLPGFSVEQLKRRRVPTLVLAAVLAVVSLVGLTRLAFEFKFEQFFPQGDPDLEFFQEFIADFESDDNFLLVGIEREAGIFDSTFFVELRSFVEAADSFPHVLGVNSLMQLRYPVKTPFAITSVPAIHPDEPAYYTSDRERLLEDKRLVGKLVNDSATGTVVALKLVNSIELEPARELMAAVESAVARSDFEAVHYLGRPYFQRELVEMQQREVIVSSFFAGILVLLAMFFIFRRPWTVAISMMSISFSLLFFFGFLGWTGRPLNAMSALYPILMIIVGTSDVIHMLTKYLSELKKQPDKWVAWSIAVRQIGLATLLTSVTTAVGFASLFTSRIGPIREFGLNAAVGVGIAYVTVIFFMGALLLSLNPDVLQRRGAGLFSWEKIMARINRWTREQQRPILLGTMVFLATCFWGWTLVSTNYRIEDQLPRGQQITQDFQYFEEEFAGFRPFEIAVIAADGYHIGDYEVLREMQKVEDFLAADSLVRSVESFSDVYKTINRMEHQNRADAYVFPADSGTFARYERYVRFMPREALAVLRSRDGTKGRVSARVADVGAEEINELGRRMMRHIESATDTSVVTFRLTGTGVIVDKNAQYVRESLITGLGLALVLVSVLMALLFRQRILLLIALIPNLIPLVFAGAVLGWLGIELEAGISIVFAIVFGIAVDDTIHFLSKYKLMRQEGQHREAAIAATFAESGKAIALTTIILFFGFMVLFFSIHPPTFTIGLLISITLGSALISDLILLPILIRVFIKDDNPLTGKNAQQ